MYPGTRPQHMQREYWIIIALWSHLSTTSTVRKLLELCLARPFKETCQRCACGRACHAPTLLQRFVFVFFNALSLERAKSECMCVCVAMKKMSQTNDHNLQHQRYLLAVVNKHKENTWKDMIIHESTATARGTCHQSITVILTEQIMDFIMKLTVTWIKGTLLAVFKKKNETCSKKMGFNQTMELIWADLGITLAGLQQVWVAKITRLFGIRPFRLCFYHVSA